MEQSFPTQIDSSVSGILSSEYVAFVVESDKGVNGYEIFSGEMSINLKWNKMFCVLNQNFFFHVIRSQSSPTKIKIFYCYFMNGSS